MITAEQRERRRQGIGGSDAAPIVLGADDYQTSLDVYVSKVFPLAADDTSPSATRGNKLEPVIRELAAEELGVTIREDAETHVHPAHPWMIVHLDGLASDGGLLEAKAIDWRKARELGPVGSDYCRREHFIQVQHAMEVTGLPWAHVAYFVSAFDLRLYLVPRDREIGEMIAAAEGRFWHQNVLARVPPATDDADARLRFNAARFARSPRDTELVIERGTPAYDALANLATARAMKREAAEVEKACAARVQDLMGETRRVRCDLGSVTWTAPGSKVSWRDVAHEAGATRALIDKHTKPAGRRFLPHFDDASDDAED